MAAAVNEMVMIRPANSRLAGERFRHFGIWAADAMNIVYGLAHNGELIEARQSADGSFVCAICGFIGLGDPPFFGTNEICPCCFNEYGFDDAAPIGAPPGTQAARFAELRRTWLERIGWLAAGLDQLRNLGIEADAPEFPVADSETAGGTATPPLDLHEAQVRDLLRWRFEYVSASCKPAPEVVADLRNVGASSLAQERFKGLEACLSEISGNRYSSEITQASLTLTLTQLRSDILGLKDKAELTAERAAELERRCVRLTGELEA